MKVKTTFLLLQLSVAAFLLFPSVSSQYDQTLVDRSIGKDVTEAVLRRITSSSIFLEDNSFLVRLAYVESRFGTSNNTFRTDYYGGIWQVEESVFRITQANHASLAGLHIAIKNRFNIDWPQVEWRQLTIPLYSGLAAALYFTRVPVEIPDTISTQADFWIKYYRPLGDRKRFIDDSEELRNQTRCRGKMDLCIVLDSSGSIGAGNYITAKGFVGNLIDSFTLDYNRIGMLIYSDNYRDIFPIVNNLLISQMVQAARGAPYLSSGTRTDIGIRRAVKHFNDTPINEGVPRLVFVFTDGNSDRGSDLRGAVQEMRNQSLKSVAVGIGSSINRAELELIAQGDNSSVFMLSGFESLQSFLYRISSVVCETPQQTSINATFNDTLIKDEKRLYEVKLPKDGVTIKITIQAGVTIGYWSRSEKVPSSAFYDGKIETDAVFIPPPDSSRTFEEAVPNSVFIAVQGLEAKNNYTLATEPGNTAGNSAGAKVIFNLVIFICIAFQFLF